VNHTEGSDRGLFYGSNIAVSFSLRKTMKLFR